MVLERKRTTGRQTDEGLERQRLFYCQASGPLQQESEREEEEKEREEEEEEGERKSEEEEEERKHLRGRCLL